MVILVCNILQQAHIIYEKGYIFQIISFDLLLMPSLFQFFFQFVFRVGRVDNRNDSGYIIKELCPGGILEHIIFHCIDEFYLSSYDSRIV